MQMINVVRGFLSSGQELVDIVIPLNSAPEQGSYRIGDKRFHYSGSVDTSATALQIRRVNCRIFFLSSSDYQVFEAGEDYQPFDTGTPTLELTVPPKPAKTDEELEAEIKEKFDTLRELSDAACKIKIRSMVVSGSAGTGKTHEVMEALQRRASEDKTFDYTVVKGTISTIALYIELFKVSSGGVLVLDDSDSAFSENDSIQLLKAATESSKKRIISYRKMSLALEAEGIPNQFTFNGAVIVLTNTNLEDGRKSKMPHYEALMSRSHYINAVLESDREKLTRIKMVIRDSDILQGLLDEETERQEVINFLETYSGRARELSIRTVVKLAELRATFPEKWEGIARTTLLK